MTNEWKILVSKAKKGAYLAYKIKCVNLYSREMKKKGKEAKRIPQKNKKW